MYKWLIADLAGPGKSRAGILLLKKFKKMIQEAEF
jgi:hypothetical protein